MKIVFRADASIDIGSGHVMRCLTLADALRDQGHEILFLCREFEGHLIVAIKGRGHSVAILPISDDRPQLDDLDENLPVHLKWLGARTQDDAAESISALSSWGRPDWLIVDHYAIDFRWERTLRNMARHVLVIDDLADRKHDCEVLLDQNLQSRPDRYSGLLPNACRRLLGPGYALLRPEFAELRKGSIRRDGNLRNILVSLGGSDSGNVTSLVIDALLQSVVRDSCHIVLVVGESNPHKAVIDRQCRLLPDSEMLVQTPHMARLMAAADLMIGAGGGAMWERCCLGLPAIVLCLAANQRENAMMAKRKRIGLALENPVGDDITVLSKLLDRLTVHPKLMLGLAKNAAAVTDGRGCQRVLEEMVSYR